jgi:hypothetical protein
MFFYMRLEKHVCNAMSRGLLIHAQKKKIEFVEDFGRGGHRRLCVALGLQVRHVCEGSTEVRHGWAGVGLHLGGFGHCGSQTGEGRSLPDRSDEDAKMLNTFTAHSQVPHDRL